MKTTTILTIIAIVGAVAATGLVSAIGLSSSAHAAGCSTTIDTNTFQVTKQNCSSPDSHGKIFNENNHFRPQK